MYTKVYNRKTRFQTCYSRSWNLANWECELRWSCRWFDGCPALQANFDCSRSLFPAALSWPSEIPFTSFRPLAENLLNQNQTAAERIKRQVLILDYFLGPPVDSNHTPTKADGELTNYPKAANNAFMLAYYVASYRLPATLETETGFEPVTPRNLPYSSNQLSYSAFSTLQR